jgi:septal ring factor EnvC (AmiA/AmiB activator)
MRANHFPSHVQTKLDQFEQAVERLTQQITKTQDAITGARQRLSGGFQRDEEYRDMRATLDKLLADQPILENKLDCARYTLTDCRAFLQALPDDAVLEPVAPVQPNGFDLDTVQRRIKGAEDEVERLRGVPTPASDIEERVREYVAALARPQVSGIATGQRLQVLWPSDVIAVLALLLPDEMVSALLREVERQSNLPMPLPQRKKRIAELQAEIDTLQRQALALGAGTSELPPAVVLGVRVARREETKRVSAA